MKIEITTKQKEAQAGFREFVRTEVATQAAKFDRDEALSPEIITKLAQQGYLGALIPANYGGSQMDWITFGLLSEELGTGCTSVRSFVMVQNMVAQSILNWGSTPQQDEYLSQLAAGNKVAAFALSEPEIGSDARHVKTTVHKSEDAFIINGCKKWISFGQIADVFLVFAQFEGEITALLVDRDTPGLSIEPMVGLTGFRASMLADLNFENCRIPVENLVGQIGFGLVPVALQALDLARYSIAWGSVGIMQTCLEACAQFTNSRQQFGSLLRDHQLIQKMLTDMIVHTKAARLLCLQTGMFKENQAPKAFLETMAAKYFSVNMARQITSDAIQIHGARGVVAENLIERFWRDTKILEIIDGSTQIHQIKIAEYGLAEFL
jgi:glutaryl-CoA dehydrogenase (non-decarboxylating)